MHLESPRVIGLCASSLLLAGWLLGSTLSPPIAQTQNRDAPRPAPAPRPLPRDRTAPRSRHQRDHAWPAGTDPQPVRVRPGRRDRRKTPPTWRRPYRRRNRRWSRVPRRRPAPAWRLLGVAVGSYGDVTAVLSGAGDVHLVQAGDTVPGDVLVIDVTASGVRLQRPDGSVLELILP